MKYAIISIIVLLGLCAGSAYVLLQKHDAPTPAVGGSLQNANFDVVGGVVTTRQSAPIRTASTTPCAVQNTMGTSTVARATLRLDTASSTATVWTIGIGTTAFSTTTAQLGTNYNVAASKQAFINGSSSPSAGAAEVVAPNNWVVFSETGGITAGDTAGTGFVPAGACSVTFVSTQA